MKKIKFFCLLLAAVSCFSGFTVLAGSNTEYAETNIILSEDSALGWNVLSVTGDIAEAKTDANGKYLELTRSAATGNRLLKRTFSNIALTDADKIKFSFKAYFGIYPTGASTGTGNYQNMFLGIRTTGTKKALLYNGTANSTDDALWWFAGAPDYDKWVKEGYTGGSGVEFVNYSWFSQETMWHEFEYTFDFANRYYTMKVDGNQVVNQLYNGTKFLIKDDFLSDIKNGTSLEFVWSLGGAITDETIKTQTIGVRDFSIRKIPKPEATLKSASVNKVTLEMNTDILSESVTKDAVKLYDLSDNEIECKTVSYNSESKTIEAVPDLPLFYNTAYKVKLLSDIKSELYNIDEKTFDFTTERRSVDIDDIALSVDGGNIKIDYSAQNLTENDEIVDIAVVFDGGGKDNIKYKTVTLTKNTSYLAQSAVYVPIVTNAEEASVYFVKGISNKDLLFINAADIQLK